MNPADDRQALEAQVRDLAEALSETTEQMLELRSRLHLAKAMITAPPYIAALLFELAHIADAPYTFDEQERSQLARKARGAAQAFEQLDT